MRGRAPRLFALWGCAFATLHLEVAPLKPVQWLRYLITMFPPLNFNQLAKPLKSFGGAAFMFSALGQHLPRFRVIEERSLWCRSPGRAAPGNATSSGERGAERGEMKGERVGEAERRRC